MTDTLEGSADQLRIQSLEADVAILNQQLATIATMLLQEAIDRDFCSDYGDFVDRVNEAIGTVVLLHMNRDYDVHFSGTLTINANTYERASESATSQLAWMANHADNSMSWDIVEVVAT